MKKSKENTKKHTKEYMAKKLRIDQEVYVIGPRGTIEKTKTKSIKSEKDIETVYTFECSHSTYTLEEDPISYTIKGLLYQLKHNYHESILKNESNNC